MIFGIYSDVTAWTLEKFRQELEGVKDEVVFEICSAGGDLFPALGMIDLVRMRGLKSSCNIYGWAASAAGIIALSCDHVRMTSNGSILLHSVWSPDGEIDEKTLDYINSRQLAIIKRRDPAFTMDDLTVETWFDAEACASHGFSDETIQFDALVKNDLVAHLVARAKPTAGRKSDMATIKAECGEKRSEEEQDVKAEDVTENTEEKDLADVVEKILERLEQMDHRIGVLEGEGKKEDDENGGVEMVAARVSKLWARACGNPVPTSKKAKASDIEKMKAASATVNKFWK